MIRTLTGRMARSLAAADEEPVTDRRRPRLHRPWRERRRRRGDARRRPSARWPTLPGVRLRGVSRLYATAPVGVTDQPEFRNAVVALDVPAGTRRRDRRPGPAGRAQGRSSGRSVAGIGVAGARASSISTCSSSAERGSRSSDRPRPVRSTPSRPRRRPRSCSRCRIRRRPPGSSSWRRSPTWRPASSRPAGGCRSRRRGAGRPRWRTRMPCAPSGAGIRLAVLEPGGVGLGRRHCEAIRNPMCLSP